MLVARVLSARLRSLLARQGRLVARRPLPFLLSPLILTTVLAYGFAFFDSLSTGFNALELYIPKQGLSKSGRERIEAVFGSTYLDELDPLNGFTYTLLLRRRDGGDILNREFMAEYTWIRRTLESMPIRVSETDGWQTYAQQCWRDERFGRCAPDFVSLLTERGLDGYRDVRLMTYPTTEFQTAAQPQPFEMAVPLGGVATTRQGFVRGARAVVMNFHLDASAAAYADAWQTEMRRTLAQWRSRDVVVSWFTMGQFERDLDSVARALRRLIPSLLLVIAVFCVISCCVADWVHSKPLLAVAAVFAAMLAVASGFGLGLLLQLPVVDIVYVAPFLCLSIAVDDSFLLLAAWRKTFCQASVEERLSQTFADAAVSITITSLTDVLSFAVGALSIFPAVKYFCLYTVLTLLFTYLYQITIFGACMVYSGRREAANRHCFLMIKLSNSAEAELEDRGFWYKVFCTGGDGKLADEEYGANCDGFSSAAGSAPPDHACLPISPKDNMLNIFFQRYYAPLLRTKAVQVAAALSYLVYIGVAIWGATEVRIGLNYADLLPDGSVGSQYLTDYRDYFATAATPPLEVLLPDMDLSDTAEQRKALELVLSFEYSTFTRGATFFLPDFLAFADVTTTSYDRDIYQVLHEFLRTAEFASYAPHVRFDALRRVVRSRFLVATRDVSYERERPFLDFVKARLADGALPNATAFHPSFQLGEQQAAVLPAMLQTVGVATVAMLLVSFLLIPRAVCSLCLAACIVSTNLGVLGAMSLWAVRLDIISLITVLMSIGISVDFVAHISYFYVQAVELDLPVTKAQRALRYLGLPILQGAASTVCGMLVLLSIRAYMIRAFVKTLLLVIIFGLYHGLLLLPIVLSLFIRDHERDDRATADAAEPQTNGAAVYENKVPRITVSANGTAVTGLTASPGAALDRRPSARAKTQPKAPLSKDMSNGVAATAAAEPTVAVTDADLAQQQQPLSVKVLTWLQHAPSNQYPSYYSSNSLH